MSGTEQPQSEEPQQPVPGETPEPEQQEPQRAESEEFKSEESKQSVLADLKKEREQRKAMQAEIDKFKAAEAEAEKAKLSDIERAQTEAKESQANAEKYQAELLKMRIAGKHGVTDEEDIELFLTGSDEETLIRQAERLAQRNSGPNNPKPDPSAGPKGEPPLTEAEKVAQAEKSGDKQAASILKAQQLGKLAQNT
ncbi:MAG: hypothetical protein L0K41_02805 [Yaniella sp.]|nr:hypothetical protein [Yaniella sp.]